MEIDREWMINSVSAEGMQNISVWLVAATIDKREIQVNHWNIDWFHSRRMDEAKHAPRNNCSSQRLNSSLTKQLFDSILFGWMETARVCSCIFIIIGLSIYSLIFVLEKGVGKIDFAAEMRGVRSVESERPARSVPSWHFPRGPPLRALNTPPMAHARGWF